MKSFLLVFMQILCTYAMNSGKTTTSSILDERHFLLLRVVKHDRTSFCQGLVNHNGFIYESAGLYGRSSIRIVDPQTGEVLKMTKLEKQYFAEGITIMDNKVHMLTYHEKTMLIFDASTLELVRKIRYSTETGEGWGLTNDGINLIASDGSNIISIYEYPVSSLGSTDQLKRIRTLNVRDKSGHIVHNVNELQYVNGYIYANVWFRDILLKINYSTGIIEQQFDMSPLFPLHRRGPKVDVFNGIAYNSTDGSFLVTGKLWPKYYHIKLRENNENQSVNTHTMDLRE